MAFERGFCLKSLLRREWIVLWWICVIILTGACQNNQVTQAQPLPVPRIPDKGPYDVIVVGGEPEGLAAALASARGGKKTLLVEESDTLGGLFTLGRLNFFDMNYTLDSHVLLTQGIFKEFYQDLGDAFDIDQAKRYFMEKALGQENLDVALETTWSEPVIQTDDQGRRVLTGLTLTRLGESWVYEARRFVDATTDGDLAAMSGVPYTIGAEDYGFPESKMAVTLVFNIKGINWWEIYIRNNLSRILGEINPNWGDPNAGALKQLVWGYGKEAKAYEPADPDMRLRGPNLARQQNGQILVNALLIFDVDPLDKESVARGLERGNQELPHVLEFMKTHFKGFKKAELVDAASRLYVRESRHIQGEYRLTITDVLENQDHWDRIAHGNYPVDIQPVSPDDLGMVVGQPQIYSIPFRCLVPLNVENLLVASRSASYDSLAHGSARVAPIGVAVGEAAGVAAGISIDEDLNFRDMSKDKAVIAELQQALISRGAYLKAYDPPVDPVMDHWAYPGLRVIRALGMASGGYHNQYGLDQPVRFLRGQNVLNELANRIEKKIPGKDIPVIYFKEGTVDALYLAEKIAYLIDQEAPKGEAAWAYLESAGIMDAALSLQIGDPLSEASVGVLYVLGARAYEYILAAGPHAGSKG
jgi:hypothetical protein